MFTKYNLYAVQEILQLNVSHFQILTRGEMVSRLLSRMSRLDIHAKTHSLMVNPEKVLQDKVRTVLVSRNPYTRLYSAYVDKVYLPLFWEHFAVMNNTKVLPPVFIKMARSYIKAGYSLPASSRLVQNLEKLKAQGLIVQRNITAKVIPVCANNGTFEDFLQYIIREIREGKPLESHWAPISHLCEPCALNMFKIVKQETFSEDVEHTLHSVGFNLSNIPWLRSSLYESRLENSIPGIIAVVETRLRLKQTQLCLNDQEVVKRLWKAFQIQGFVSDTQQIPDTFKSPTFVFRKDLVSQAVLSAVRVNPLTTAESKRQRKRYLKMAYRNVGEDTLKAIQEIFKLDFTLFGYSSLPP